MNLMLATLVILAGGFGAALRLWLGSWVGVLPWGILLANTAASFVAGLATGGLTGDEGLQTLLVVGLAGGLSTFSSFAGQTVDYFRRGRIAQGLGNIGANMALVCTAATLGLWLAGILLK